MSKKLFEIGRSFILIGAIYSVLGVVFFDTNKVISGFIFLNMIAIYCIGLIHFIIGYLKRGNDEIQKLAEKVLL